MELSPSIMPKVSVIVPNYNHAAFLDRRLRSVLSQTYEDFEVLYLDDASSDGSNDVFAAYAADPRIRAFFNRNNSGSPFKQWNRGVCEARGEYIWIAESDDYADETLLARLVSVLDANPNVGVAYCQSWRVDEEDQIIGSGKDFTDEIDQERWKSDFMNDGRDECRRFMARKNTIPNASAVVFRRSVYTNVGSADETFRLTGDWILWIKMLLASDVAFVATPLNYFRAHPQSVRHTARVNGVEFEEAYRMVYFLSRTVAPPPEIVEPFYERVLNLWLETALYRTGSIPWRRNLRILSLSLRADRRLLIRLAKKAVPDFLKRPRQPVRSH